MRWYTWAVALACLLAATAPCSSSVPSTMAYQGKLTDSLGQPVADGAYNMRFYLYDNESGGSLLWQEPWSGTEPVQVSQGLFDVQLGSSVPLPPGAFTGNTWLAVEVNGTALPARFRIVSTGYAMRAMVADSLPANSITSSMIVDGQVTTYDIADDAVTSAKIADGGIGFADLGPNGAPAGQVIKRNSTNTGWTFGSDEAVPDTDWTESGGNVYRASGNLGIGVSSPGYPLHVKNATGDTEVMFEAGAGKVRFNLDSADDSYVDFQVNGVSKGIIGYEAGGDYLYLQKGAGTANTVALKNGNVGIGVTSPASKLHVAGDLRLDQRIIASDSGGLELATDDAVTRVMIGDSGNVGIGTTSPQAKLHVAGPIRLAQQIMADDSTGLNLATDDGVSRVKVQDNGNVGIGTTSPDYTLHVFRANGNIQSKIESDSGDADLLLDGTTDESAVEFRSSGTYTGSVGYSTANDYLFVHQSGGGDVGFQYGNLGVGTVSPSAGLDIGGSAGLKVGADGLVAREIQELVGITRDDPYPGGFDLIDLPAGYNYTNTRVLCAQVYKDYDSMHTWHARMCSVDTALGDHFLYLDLGGYEYSGVEVNFHNCPYRVLIMRMQ